MNVTDMVAESNRIEGIIRPPTNEEIEEHARFLSLDRVTVEELQQFVSVYQAGAQLRDRPGLNVMVGRHRPPIGGPTIRTALESLLVTARDPWRTHIEYELLHPFTDGNGRSGRMLWYWMMRDRPLSSLGFLHAFYYQTLRATP